MKKKRSSALKIFLSLLLIGSIAFTVVVLQKTQFFKQFASYTSCNLDDYLVPNNNCRPLLGASSNNYPDVPTDKKSQLLAHETRLQSGANGVANRHLDMVRNYHPIGDNQLSPTDLYFVNRTDAQTTLMITWKPTAIWADADGINDPSTVTAGIDKMAQSIKAVAPKKIFLTIYHEPENDTSGGGTCTSYKGTAGTTTEYVNMWKNVRQRFQTIYGTTPMNIVWFVNFMNYPQWDCVFEELYPGDDLVDWIFFGGYGTADQYTFEQKVGHMYNKLMTSTKHNYKAKPFGIDEWGIRPATVEQKLSYFQQAKDALDNNRFPNIKAYSIFDQNNLGDPNGTNLKVAYDDSGVFHQELLDKYNSFANDPIFLGSSTSTQQPTPTPIPTLTPTSTQPITSGTTQWVLNQSVEADITGWTDVYGKPSLVSLTKVTGIAHIGIASIKVAGKNRANNDALGFVANPKLVASTVTATIYTQSAWVKPTFIGQKITLLIREMNGGKLVNDRSITLTASDVNWHQLTQTLTATSNGNQIDFAVYSNNLSFGQSFYADDFSLISSR